MAPTTLHLAAPHVAMTLDGPPVQVWPDPSGCIRASAFRAGAGYRIDWPGLARFELSGGDEPVTAVSYPQADVSTIEDVFARFVVPLAWHLRGHEALHASAICLDNGNAVAFCAASGTGKSTMACGLAVRGHAHLSDDGVLLDISTNPPRVTASAPGIRLRAESSCHFGLPTPSGRAVVTDRLTTIGAAPLAGLIVLDRSARHRHAAMRRLYGGEALAAVLAHAHLLDPADDQRRRLTVTHYLSVLERAAVWRLEYPSGFDRLSEALDAVERACSWPC